MTAPPNTSINGLLDFAYTVSAEEREHFGAAWSGPDKFPHQQSVQIASYLAIQGGHNVIVMCAAYPARFYKIMAQPHVNWDGRILPGFVMETGSGQGELAAKMALALSQGMLTMSPER